MKNKQNYWEYMLSDSIPLFHVLVIMIFLFLMIVGFLGLCHKFVITQPLLEPHDILSNLRNSIFMPFIDCIKELVVFTVGEDFESSKLDYVSIFGFGILSLSFGGLHIYCKFLDRK